MMSLPRPRRRVEDPVLKLVRLVYNYFVCIQSVPMRAVDVNQIDEERLREEIRLAALSCLSTRTRKKGLTG